MLRITLSGLAVGLISSLAPAQNPVTLVSSWDKYVQYAGCWGYVAPDGREFALVGERTGLWIVETTDPTNLTEIAYFSAPASLWREITSHGQYVYAVSEHHSGVRVIDMGNPTSPVDLGTIKTGDLSKSHSISVDPDAGHLYVNGASSGTGMWIYDIGTNPTNPPFLGRYRQNYVHDSHIRRGRAYLSEIWNGRCRIMDVTDFSKVSSTTASVLNSITVANILTPGAFTHNAWVTDDDQLLATTDENSSGRVTLYDIAIPSSPVQKGTYGKSGEITHNVFLMGRVAYIAHYSNGLHVVDVSDPNTPKKIGSYDTSAATGSYNGMWGAYPFQPSGSVYGSDMANGLFVFQIDCGHINRFGQGTAGAGGKVPFVQADGAPPKLNAPGFRFEVEDLAPNALFAIIASDIQANQQFAGTTLYVDLPSAMVFYGQADGSGYGEINIPIPNIPAWANKKFYAQAFAIDPAAPKGVSASRGMWFGICP